MNSKKLKRIVFLFLFAFLIGLVSSESCSITQKSWCESSNILMGLQSSTNTHGDLGGSYSPYVVCCDFPGASIDCTGKQAVIKLDSPLNAHAEIPSGTSYNTKICYDNLYCQHYSSIGSQCPDKYPIETISLADQTNAHIGGFTEYPTQICCKKINYTTSIARTDPSYTSQQVYNEKSTYEEIVYKVVDSSDGEKAVSGADILLWRNKTISDSTIQELDGESIYSLYGVRTGVDGKITIRCDFTPYTFPGDTYASCSVTGDTTTSFTISEEDLRGEYTEEYAKGKIILDGVEFATDRSNELSFIIRETIPLAQWKNEFGRDIGKDQEEPYNTLLVKVDKTKAIMNLEHPRLTDGIEVTFEIYENNGFWIFGKDSEIRVGDDAIKVISKGNKSMFGEWLITAEDLDVKANGDLDEFYFLATARGNIRVQSKYLEIEKYNPDLSKCEQTIVTCSGYDNQISCQMDDCEVEMNSDKNCGKPIKTLEENCYYKIECECIWEDNMCKSYLQEVLNPECLLTFKYPASLGGCNIIQSLGEDNCDDGFLTYNWTAFWSWESNNYTSESQVPGDETPVLVDGWWHYPSTLVFFCIDGGRDIACPTAILLSFFTLLEMIITLIVIALGYYFISRKIK